MAHRPRWPNKPYQCFSVVGNSVGLRKLRSQTPCDKLLLRFRRVVPDPRYSHPVQSDRLGNLAGVHRALASQVQHGLELLTAERRLAATVCIRVSLLPISASRTAFCIGSFVLPSNVNPLITVLMITPFFMKR